MRALKWAALFGAATLSSLGIMSVFMTGDYVFQLEESSSVTIPAGTTNGFEKTCASGYQPVSGGARIMSASVGAAHAYARPGYGEDGETVEKWIIRVDNTSTSDVVVRVWVVCANPAP